MLTMTKIPAPSKKPQQKEAFWHKWGKLVVLSLALAIIVIDTTLLNVSLRDIVADLDTNFTQIQWVITIYTLTLAAFTITGGRLGDLYGRKRVFMLGAILFGVGSFIASISLNITHMLIGESLIEGLGAALMMPATASLLVTNYEGRDRAIAFAFFGAVAGGASALGPILGGWLTTNYSWRWGFRINVFVVIVLLAGSFLIKDARDKLEKTEIDWLGVVLSSLGLLALVFGIIQSSDYGWWLAKQSFDVFRTDVTPWGLSVTPIAIALGVALLTAFVFWQKRREALGHTPLVSLSLFKNRQFVSGMSVTAANSLSLTGLIFVLPIYFQVVHGLDAFQTGMALFPLSLAVFISSPAALLLAKKLRPKTIIMIGLVGTAGAVFMMIRSLTAGADVNSLIPGLVFFGASVGLIQSQVNNLTLSAVDENLAGEASGVNNTMRQVGASFGAALIGAALFANIATQIGTKIQADSVIPNAVRDKIVAQARESAKNGGIDSAEQNQQPDPSFLQQIAQLPPAAQSAAIQKYREEQVKIGQAVKNDVENAIVVASQDTLWVAFGFAVVAILIGLGLPNVGSFMGEGPGAGKPNVGH